MHAAPTAFVSRFTATPNALACTETAESVGRASSACAMNGATNKYPAAARQRAVRFRARAESVAVMPVVVIVSVSMIIMSVPMVFVFMPALTLFPALPLYFAFALMLLIVTLIVGLVFL